MDPVLAAVVAVLCQYPIAILSLIKLFGMKKEKNVTIIWNVIIIVIPFLGAAAFWIYYVVNHKKGKKSELRTAEEKARFSEENKTVTDTLSDADIKEENNPDVK